MKEDEENKMKLVPENKMKWPPENKKVVKVQIAPGRDVIGIGKSGEVIMLDEKIARVLIEKGLAIQVKE